MSSGLSEAPPDRAPFYLSLLPAIRDAAWLQGYAIATHGTLRRDFDLVAVPWIENATDADDLARAVADAVGGYLLLKRDGQLASRKPLGRRAYTIHFGPRVERLYPHPDGWGVFIDLSVTPKGP